MDAAGLLLVTGRRRWMLALRRSKRVSEPGTWAAPGGKLERGETPDEAAGREFAEETGVRQVSAKLLGVVRSPLSSGGDFSLFIAEVTAKEAHRVTTNLRLNWESDEALWLSVARTRSPLHPGFEATLPDIRRVLRTK